MTPQFAKAVDPIFEAALTFASKIENVQGGGSFSTSDERAILTKRIEEAEKALGKTKAWELAKYAICSWIDARLTKDSQWKESNWWKNNSLESHYFKTQLARHRFFEKASEADNLAERDAMEVFYLAVVLGFRGFYDDPPLERREKSRELDLPESLERWFQKFAKSMYLRQERPDIPGEPIIGGNKEPLTGKIRILQYSMISLALLAMALSLWSWYLKSWIPVVIGLPIVFATAGLLYWFLLLRRKEESTKYPDIDRVMQEGFQQLAASGIPLSTTPIFLVLGTQDATVNRRLLEAANLKISVQVPKSLESALSIHASKEAIWIMPHHCSAISRLSNASDGGPTKTTRATRQASESEEEEYQGTMVMSDSEPEDDEGEWGAIEGEDDDEVAPDGTIQLTDDFDIHLKKDSKPAPVSTKKISIQDLGDAESRLRYLCTLLRNARKNACPIDGLVTTIPFELIEKSNDQLPIALEADLKVLRNELKVRVANTLLITGMENDPGFVAMTSRLGSQRINKQRIGKGSEIWFNPENKRLLALAKHATAVFEDLCFELFQEEDRFQDKQNPKLFSLLKRMRGTFAHNLAKVMETVLGFDPLRQPELHDTQFLFSGCYFIACGSDKKRQAFVPSAIRKVMEVRQEIEWVKGVSQQDAKYRRIANLIAIVVGLGSIIAIAAMIALKIKESFF